MDTTYIAIVDYGLGNLFSVQQACKKVGLQAVITSSSEVIFKSAAVILTGVGAFGKAMMTLEDRGLTDVLRDYVLSGKPLAGICLGMQLLMTESYEFGRHEGLNIIKGNVLRLKTTVAREKMLKVPLIGWYPIHYFCGSDNNSIKGDWKGTLLEGIRDGAQMYFVHSYFVEPTDKEIILSQTRYGDNLFCSSIRKGNVSAFQFHPECSGPNGLKIYDNLAKQIMKKLEVSSERNES